MDIEALFDAGFAEHQAGNLNEAQVFYRHVLDAQPRHADASHLMGVAAYQLGRLDAAERFIVDAIAVKPSAEYFGNLGLVLAASGKTGPAIAAYRRAISLRENFAEAHNNLANILKQTGRVAEAIAAYQRAITARPDFSEAYTNLGSALIDVGKFDEAIVNLRSAIALHPTSADARNHLGVALSRTGELARALDCWREALSLRPAFAEVHNNLGNALKQLGRLDEAAAAFGVALELQPNLPEARNNLGVVRFEQGRVADAIAAYRETVAVRPDFADAHYNLAIALHSRGEATDAIDACGRAIALRPDWPAAHNNVGIWLGEIGKPLEALAAFDAAIASCPSYPQAHNNRGNMLRQMGRLDEAIESYRRAIALCPESPDAWNNLGTVLKQLGRLDDAIEAFNRALSYRPDLAEPHNNLGNVFKDQGELDQAIACYERALALRPEDASADSNRVYTLYFHPDYTAGQILAEHQRWNLRHAQPLASEIRPHENDSSPSRRLRIGYVAPDFRDHCQSLFTVPLLSHHDHERFEIFCYSDVASPDAVTDRIRKMADVWRYIAGMSDARVAEMIRHDRIDILVDLTLHMSHNRLLVFARKPAPIHATWLGYPGTTGLEAMDYRLSDPHLDPPGHDHFYSEKTVRLPDSFWCYDPLASEPAVNPLPDLGNRFITFGCLNNFCKINAPTLCLWAEVMRNAPESRLLLLAPMGAARQRVLEILHDQGIHSSRVEFSGRLSRRRYLELYHRIDIGLDTFPYNGHTTSLDAAWMGVPVVTRFGQTAVSRGGYSQLCNLELPELASNSDGGFMQAACELASDIGRLRELRGTLRNRLERSSLMDAPRFATNMEAAFRAMWETWTASRGTSRLRKIDGLELYIKPSTKRRQRRARQAS